MERLRSVIDRALYNELVIMALATTMMTSPLLALLERRGAADPTPAST